MDNPTVALSVLQTNNSEFNLNLVKSEVTKDGKTTPFQLPQFLAPWTTYGEGHPLPPALPYSVSWTYAMDDGETYLYFKCTFKWPESIEITHRKTGPNANIWILSDHILDRPTKDWHVWWIRFYYSNTPRT